MIRSMQFAIVTFLTLGLVLAACERDSAPPTDSGPGAELAQESLATVVDDAAMADETAGDNWLAFGRTYSEQRFSPLTQINDSNVAGLGVDWYIDLPEARGLTSTPLIVDGVMYFVASMNRVNAPGNLISCAQAAS